MTYNIHPIFVHFPVALLLLYSVIKIIPLKKWFPSVAWKDVERVLLFFGLLGALVALVTGSIAKNIIHPNPGLVTAHETFALASTSIYGLLLLLEVISIFKQKYSTWSSGLFSKLLALLGLISISITGMLGGVMVYGLTADPLAPFILKLLGVSY